MEDQLSSTARPPEGMTTDEARAPREEVAGGFAEDESQAGAGGGSLDRILTTIERREIVNALRQANGQRTQAARLLGISRSRLYRRMEALGVDPRKVDPTVAAR